ncbi:hypothetical protein Taro_024936 [Colocasia esculenta]|uniref:MPBQ/MBSQ family SAM-binding methyltransferase profile domain-containing protein n=1 Tax=Colocasia esculenta TaxID=4460 RepID=A0A843V8U4_COLES|nr:hypothetical protein [Colocasia esculenta]
MQASVTPPRPMSQSRPIQHKKEAFWFYRFLSIFYDRSTRTLQEEMRANLGVQKSGEEALEPANLCDRRLRVVDVGGGTGYSTLGIVRHVDAEKVTLLDQSVHQLAKARQKAALKKCTIIQGDAEDLPFPTDHADRYVSAGRYNVLVTSQRI